MEWTALLREFGLPIVVIAFLLTGVLVTGRSLTTERATAAERLAEWKQRTADEHQRALDAESRLDKALPALALATEQLKTAREDLARGLAK